MSLLLIFLYLFSAFFVFSQIGGKLTARNSLTWLLVFGFLGFAIFAPDQLIPLARILGVQLVSNLLFAGLIFFLVFQSMHESAFTTRISRRFRDLVTTLGTEQGALKPLPSGGPKRTLAVIPCYNEAENLPNLFVLLADFRLKFPNSQVDFCIIDDGSQDDSRNILKAQDQFPYVLLPTNVGVSAVTLTGFRLAMACGYERVAQADADGQHPISSLPEMIHFQEEHSCDLVIGSRFLQGRKGDASTTQTRILGSILIGLALRMFSLRFRISDPTSGFRVYSKKAAALLMNRMPDEYPEPESIAILLSNGLTVAEVPVRMLPRTRGVSSLAGLKGPKFMLKVFGSLMGLRLRSWLG